jgi:hypothetical protein
MNENNSGSEKDSEWCSVLIDESEVKRRIKHVGRGKFRITDDMNEGKYTNTVVDASDVIHCR